MCTAILGRHRSSRCTNIDYRHLLKCAQPRPALVAMVGAIDLPFRYDWERTSVRAGTDGPVPPVSILDRFATVGYPDGGGLTVHAGPWCEPASG